MNANSSPTTHNWLSRARQFLLGKGIETADLDSLVLLEDCLQIPRANILAHPEQKLTTSQLTQLNKQLKQRGDHEPLAYIRGKSEFYGRTFIVNRYTLQPRPETETMIELLKKLRPKDCTIIADIGTGTGAIAITAQLELPKTRLIATDMSKKSLMVAQQNMDAFNLKIALLQGDLLEPLAEKEIDILLCNLPYVPDGFAVNTAAQHEPKIALFGGNDGLDLYRELFVQVQKRKQKPSHVLTEALPSQHTQLQIIAEGAGYKLRTSEDFIQVFTI